MLRLPSVLAKVAVKSTKVGSKSNLTKATTKASLAKGKSVEERKDTMKSPI